ncbi:ornithine decarboxylase-like [Symphorus nematophorus]
MQSDKLDSLPRVNALAGEEGTEQPFYVANLDCVFKKHLRWLTHLPRVKPHYAVKCNSTPAVLRMLSALGTGFDCASKGEIQLVLSLGVTPDRIIYAHTTKPQSHIKYAHTHGIDVMTFDNEEELLKISRCHAKTKLVLRIAVDDSESMIRLSSKFGARLVSVGKLLERAGELNLEVIGVSFHVGSGCTGSLSFKQAIADARHVFDIANLLGIQMSVLDIGGGFSGREDFKFKEFSEVINGALDELFPPDSGVQIIAEPGRYYVESAFTLAANVIAKSAVESSEQRHRSIIWGPTCDSLDKVSDSCWIPELHVGDWLLFDDMGAYSVSICSDFNGFERPHVHCVVTADTWHILNHSYT